MSVDGIIRRRGAERTVVTKRISNLLNEINSENPDTDVLKVGKGILENKLSAIREYNEQILESINGKVPTNAEDLQREIEEIEGYEEKIADIIYKIDKVCKVDEKVILPQQFGLNTLDLSRDFSDKRHIGNVKLPKLQLK